MDACRYGPINSVRPGPLRRRVRADTDLVYALALSGAVRLVWGPFTPESPARAARARPDVRAGAQPRPGRQDHGLLSCARLSRQSIFSA